MAYDRRTQHPPQFTPIQEGAVQDQDGLGSMLSANAAQDRDDIAQQIPDGQPPTTQGGYNHQDRYRQMYPRIAQPASTSSSMHIDYRPYVGNSSSLPATGNRQPIMVNSSTYAQSVSGCSSYGMNIPSGGHLQQLPDSIEPSLNWPSPCKYTL